MSSSDIYRDEAVKLQQLSAICATAQERYAFLRTARLWSDMAIQSELLVEAVAATSEAGLAASDPDAA